MDILRDVVTKHNAQLDARLKEGGDHLPELRLSKNALAILQDATEAGLLVSALSADLSRHCEHIHDHQACTDPFCILTKQDLVVFFLQALGTETFVKASLAAAHARRRTVKETDVQLVEQLKHMPCQSGLSA